MIVGTTQICIILNSDIKTLMFALCSLNSPFKRGYSWISYENSGLPQHAGEGPDSRRSLDSQPSLCVVVAVAAAAVLPFVFNNAQLPKVPCVCDKWASC